MMQQDAERMIECLQTRGVGFDAGLSDEEVQNKVHCLQFVFYSYKTDKYKINISYFINLLICQ